MPDRLIGRTSEFDSENRGSKPLPATNSGSSKILIRLTNMKKTDISHIFDGFKDLTLPKDEWTHEAHLIAALCLLIDHGLEKAEAIMPDMIRDYNISRGGINSDTDGYHHTITIFYLRMIEKFRIENPNGSREKQVQRLLNSEIAKPYYTMKYYSKEALFTPAARLGFVLPDIQKY